MKAFLVGLILLIVIGTAGYMGFQYLSLQNKAPNTVELQNSTLNGKILPGKGDDYSFVLLDATGKTTGITSQTIQLDAYVNKNVEVTGSFSGSTLYVYTLTEK